MIRWYHWILAGAIHVAFFTAAFVATQRRGPEAASDASATDAELQRVDVRVVPDTPPEAEPTTASSEPLDDAGEAGRKQYEAVAGDARGDREDSQKEPPKPPKERQETREAAADTAPGDADKSEPANGGFARAQESPKAEPSSSTPAASAAPPVAHGNAAFTRRDGERVPPFILSDLDARLIQALVRDRHLLLVATMGGRNIRFSGPPTNPTTAFVDDRLAGYSQRGLQAPERIRDAAWRVLAREFGYRTAQRNGAQIDFVLSRELDDIITAAQRDAAAEAQMPLSELRATSGRLVDTGSRYEFVIESVD